MTSSSDNLKKERMMIDRIDREIIALLGKRLSAIKKIGKIKKKIDLPARDRKRWKEAVALRKKLAIRARLDPEMIGRIYEIIHRYALRIEKED